MATSRRSSSSYREEEEEEQRPSRLARPDLRTAAAAEPPFEGPAERALTDVAPPPPPPGSCCCSDESVKARSAGPSNGGSAAASSSTKPPPKKRARHLKAWGTGRTTRGAYCFSVALPSGGGRVSWAEASSTRFFSATLLKRMATSRRSSSSYREEEEEEQRPSRLARPLIAEEGEGGNNPLYSHSLGTWMVR
jgi:hypothetical protein